MADYEGEQMEPYVQTETYDLENGGSLVFERDLYLVSEKLERPPPKFHGVRIHNTPAGEQQWMITADLKGSSEPPISERILFSFKAYTGWTVLLTPFRGTCSGVWTTSPHSGDAVAHFARHDTMGEPMALSSHPVLKIHMALAHHADAIRLLAKDRRSLRLQRAKNVATITRLREKVRTLEMTVRTQQDQIQEMEEDGEDIQGGDDFLSDDNDFEDDEFTDEEDYEFLEAAEDGIIPIDVDEDPRNSFTSFTYVDFKLKFSKYHVPQGLIKKMRDEFRELKQGRMSVVESRQFSLTRVDLTIPKHRNNSSGGFTPETTATCSTYRPNYKNNHGGPPKPRGNNNNNRNPNSHNNNGNNTNTNMGRELEVMPSPSPEGQVQNCYECGVVGHFSKECPKKLAKIAANTAAPAQQQRRFVGRRNQNNNNSRFYHMTATEAQEAPQTRQLAKALHWPDKPRPDTPEPCQACGDRAVTTPWTPPVHHALERPTPPLPRLPLRLEPPPHPLAARHARVIGCLVTVVLAGIMPRVLRYKVHALERSYRAPDATATPEHLLADAYATPPSPCPFASSIAGVTVDLAAPPRPPSSAINRDTPLVPAGAAADQAADPRSPELRHGTRGLFALANLAATTALDRRRPLALSDPLPRRRSELLSPGDDDEAPP
ncbi:hypothetical protein QYE76_049962 [Lolium multiflorum]|uniref:CCHC-type domain-containing protein n=1 Tax=Lolium multiflorum TaxID=4521 RepID=A0AAD8SR40_LOLMU|nr:hypothetical protein QYE76_049962 [Lolium multiflorum]